LLSDTAPPLLEERCRQFKIRRQIVQLLVERVETGAGERLRDTGQPHLRSFYRTYGRMILGRNPEIPPQVLPKKADQPTFSAWPTPAGRNLYP
jgi:hypothetical protein